MLTTAIFQIVLQDLSTLEKVTKIEASMASPSCDFESIVSEPPIYLQHGTAVDVRARSGWISCSTQELESYMPVHVDLSDHIFALRIRGGDSASLKRAVADFVGFFANDLISAHDTLIGHSPPISHSKPSK